MSRGRNQQRNHHRNQGNNRNGNSGDTRKKGKPGIFINRRNPGFCLLTPYDIWLNIKERVYCWANRVPAGSRIYWDKDNRIKGHSTNSKRPYFGR